MKKILLIISILAPAFIFSQNVTVKITLLSTEGGVHDNMNVTLVNTTTGAEYSGKTGDDGKVAIQVPPNAMYEMKIPDYTAEKYINVPNAPNATMTSTLYYSKNMVAEEKAFAMNDEEKKAVDDFANALPDTTWFRNGNPFKGADHTFYSNVELELKNLQDGPLSDEMVTLTGRKRHKAFKGITNSIGKIMLLLPKGDVYDLSFQYHKNYEQTECKYSKGTSEITWEFEYMGTKEYLRKKKEEEEKQAAELAAIAKMNERDAARAKAMRASNAQRPYDENGVAGVLDGNNFSDPLIICDASAGMAYILDDLQAWFKKNEAKNANAQFVFFNDGDAKSEQEKKIGETGGLYYTPALPLDKLTVFINSVLEKSKDTDTPDNYVEALIKGVEMAKKPYGDIILIVDNHATARDMELLSKFNHPVHVVVFCSIKGGCDHSFCQPDYLKIAWKTKGTLHIDGKDYNNIANLKDGETIMIGNGGDVFKLKNGEFFSI